MIELLVCLALGIATGAGAAPVSPDPAALLARALQGPLIPYQGQMEATRWYGKQARTEEINVFFSPPDLYRWEFLSPQGAIERVLVSDGDTEELRLLRRGKALRGDPTKSAFKLMSPEREHALLLANYGLSSGGQETVAGRKTWTLDISPKRPDRPGQRLWIDQESGAVLANKRSGAQGLLTARTRFTRFEPGRSPAQGLFQLESSAAAGSPEAHDLDPAFLTVEELDKALGKPSRFPRELPGGFAFESASFFEVRGRTVRHARYTDGLAVLSLFQTDRPVRLEGLPPSPNPGPSGSSLRLSSAGRVLHWRAGNLYYTLVGDVSRDLLRLSASALGRP